MRTVASGEGSGPVPLVSKPAPPADLLVRGAWACDPREGIDGPLDVLVRSGEIAQLGAPGSLEEPRGAEVLDGARRHLLPGFVDAHAHLRVPGDEHEEDLDSGTRAAAAGGFVAVIAMPNTKPPVDSAPILRSLREAAGREARVPVGFLAAITRGQHGSALTDMAELRETGALGFSDDGVPVQGAGILRRALQYQRLCGGVLALHEEDPTLSGDGVMHEGEVSALLGMAGVPAVSESTMVARDAALARYEDGRVHMLHLSAAGSVEAVAGAKAAGAKVTAEASPHHLTLTHEAVGGSPRRHRAGASADRARAKRGGPAPGRECALGPLDTRTKMNPPLRAEEDRRALVAALRDGTIDCVATDHAPHAPEEKEAPFEEAPMGTTGLETAFAVLHSELVRPGVLSLATLVERMTAGAQPYGLPVPRLAVGEPANLCLADLDAEWTVGESGYESRSENCCFAGRMLTGRILLTVAAGTIAYRERALALVP